MNIILQFSVLVVALSALEGHHVKIFNNCPYTVWPGIQGNPGKPHLEGGGFELHSHQSKVINVGAGWAGRFWGRTGCNPQGRCVTGDCGGKIKCNGAGGVPPVTLAEWTFDGSGHKDYYDISLVDGYNLPMLIKLVAGTHKVGGGKYECKSAGCHSDLNAICPGELAVKHNGHTVACKSACMAFNTDAYCCRGAHNRPETCRSKDWPKNYPAIFKKACPDAYSYAYDDTTSTFTCVGNPQTSYEIVFCP